MNQDLPMNVDPTEEKGTITYATEVIATIVGVATTEVEGIASMSGAASISELFQIKKPKVPFCVIAIGTPNESPKSRGFFDESKVTYIE